MPYSEPWRFVRRSEKVRRVHTSVIWHKFQYPLWESKVKKRSSSWSSWSCRESWSWTSFPKSYDPSAQPFRNRGTLKLHWTSNISSIFKSYLLHVTLNEEFWSQTQRTLPVLPILNNRHHTGTQDSEPQVLQADSPSKVSEHVTYVTWIALPNFQTWANNLKTHGNRVRISVKYVMIRIW